YMVPTVTSADSAAWRVSLVARLDAIIAAGPVSTLRPNRLQSGAAAVPLGAFFAGSIPDKQLTVQILRLGGELDVFALSAEATVEWQSILDDAAPRSSQAIRLYTG